MNYFGKYRHMTNNACEAYNSKINKWFEKKSSFFKLIYELRIEDSTIVINYNKREAGLLGHKYRRNTKYIKLEDMIENFSEEIKEMPDSNNEEKKLIALKWFDFLKKIQPSSL